MSQGRPHLVPSPPPSARHRAQQRAERNAQPRAGDQATASAALLRVRAAPTSDLSAAHGASGYPIPAWRRETAARHNRSAARAPRTARPQASRRAGYHQAFACASSAAAHFCLQTPAHALRTIPSPCNLLAPRRRHSTAPPLVKHTQSSSMLRGRVCRRLCARPPTTSALRAAHGSRRDRWARDSDSARARGARSRRATAPQTTV